MTQDTQQLQPSSFNRLLTGRPLDAVKILAAVAMVVDHFNAMLFDWQYTWAYLIGRAAFPLFCWAAAAAIIRARDDRALYRQAGILLLWAVLAEPISRYARDYEVANVLFTLALGVLVAPFYLRRGTIARLGLAWAAIVLTLCGGWWEFATSGLLLPAALAVMLRERRMIDVATVLLLLATMNFRGLFFYEAVAVPLLAVTAIATIVLPLAILVMVRDVLPRADAGSPPPRRLLPRYALHVFYPLHIVVLWLLK